MLGKKDKVNLNSTDTLIGEKTVVEGDIRTRASLRIEGKVDGDIECAGDVMIGKSGEAQSKINARNVINAGKVDGAIEAKGMLSILPTGSVIGDIVVKSLSIADGGIFQGSCSMNSSPPDSQPAQQEQTGDAQKKLHKFEKKQAEESNPPPDKKKAASH